MSTFRETHKERERFTGKVLFVSERSRGRHPHIYIRGQLSFQDTFRLFGVISSTSSAKLYLSIYLLWGIVDRACTS